MFRTAYMLVLISAFAATSYAQICGQCNPVYPAPYLPPNVGAEYVWDYSTCSWVMVACNGHNGCSSPIVIDTDGSGFHLTSAANGVMFDFYGNGKPIQLAWTAEGSTNGWLALPRDGQVTSARDLFGNVTAQPLTNSHPPNGFAALAVYDSLALGGNNNGAIDPGDSIWARLRVWIDANHDGISQPEELHTLGEIGIERILLRYEPTLYTDEYGNHFRYKGHVIPVRDDKVDRKIYDVFLATQ
jgi:hypothetical protein